MCASRSDKLRRRAIRHKQYRERAAINFCLEQLICWRSVRAGCPPSTFTTPEAGTGAERAKQLAGIFLAFTNSKDYLYHFGRFKISSS